MSRSGKQNFMQGAAILTATVAVTKLLGAIYKIPLYNLLGDEGTTHFQIAYTIYNLFLTVATAGVPVALSRLISTAAATGRDLQAKRYFDMAMPLMMLVGFVCMVVMFIFPQQLGALMGDPEIKWGIVCLAPAVLFCCIIAVYRGWSQGYSDMVPTAVSQLIEVVSKLAVGLVVAYIIMKLGSGTPEISAGAITGSTVGLGISIPILMAMRRRAVRDNSYEMTYSDSSVTGRRTTLREIVVTTIPITLGASVLNIIALIDTRLVLSRLQNGAGFAYEDAKVLYGVFSKAQTLFNLPSALIVPLTVSVVPAIAAAIASKNRREAKNVMSSSLKVTNLLAMPMGAGLAVLSYSIFNVLYWGSNENGPALLAVLGIASYFVCLQLVTTAFLQACGLERLAMYTLPIGGIIKIFVTWFLVGSSSVGIMGAPIGTLVSYVVITLLNLLFLWIKAPARPDMKTAFVKPLVCTAVMSAAAWAFYGLLYRAAGSFFSAGRMRFAILMCISILAAIIVYAVLIIATGALTKEDMKLLPKGERIAKILHLK